MKKFISLLIVILLVTGCKSNYLKEDKKNVTYEKTGQILPSNILCKPEDKELYKIYEKYNSKLTIPLEKLPRCSDFKVNSNKSQSLWEGLFIKPLAYLILRLGDIISNYGISLILIGLAIRIILLPFSRKSQLQAEQMKKINPELQKIQRKYQDKTDSESVMARSQETMLLYKKYNISPFSSMLLAFLQLPLFFAFLQAINRVPVIFEDKLFGLYLGMTPLVGLKSGKYLYLVLILLTLLTTYFSFKKTVTSTGDEAQDKQMKSMLGFMLVFITLATFSLSTAICLYWIATNGFVVIQNYIIKKTLERPNKKNKSAPKISIKEKLKKRRGK